MCRVSRADWCYREARRGLASSPGRSGVIEEVYWSRIGRKAASELGSRIRHGLHRGHTTGFAPGFVQGNVVILPVELADEFTLYFQRNPKPCPPLARGEVGDPCLLTLGNDIDIRTDVPAVPRLPQGI